MSVDVRYFAAQDETNVEDIDRRLIETIPFVGDRPLRLYLGAYVQKLLPNFGKGIRSAI